MEERKRPERDDEAQTEKERQQEQAEDQGEKQDEEERDEQVEAAEEEELKHEDPAAHAALVLMLMHRVLRDGSLEDHLELPKHERRGLEMLHEAKVGEQGGEMIAASARMQYLVEAMAQLQPVLALARAPALEPLAFEIEEIRGEIDELRKHLRTKSASTGGAKKKKAKELGSEVPERSRDGQLAWEVAELARKKRPRFAHDPRVHPIGRALERLGQQLVAIGKIAAELAALDVERRAEKDPARTTELDRQWQQRGAALAAALAELLRGCRAGAADPAEPGAHPALAEALGPFVAEAEAELDTAAAIALAARVAATIDELLDHQDDLVGDGDAGDARKRGLLGRIFGRKGS